MAPNLTGAQSSTQAIFALDIITAAIALTLLGLATRPTLKRIKARKFTVRNKDTGSPLKTTLGTYLFLYPALFFLFIAYLFRFINDLLKTSGPGIDYDGDLQLHGRRPTQNDTGYDYSIAVLSFAADMASIFYTTLLNGGVWIYANHVTSNGTNLARQDWKSKIWNTFIMFSILGTGLAAWGLAIAARRHADWYSAMVESDHTTRIVHIVYRAVVVAASLSVSVEVLRRYAFVRKLSSKSIRERPHLARFAIVVVPLIWLRNIFIIYDIVLIFCSSSAWSQTSRLASLFLLTTFGRFADVTILGMILYGAWTSGHTVDIFGE